MNSKRNSRLKYVTKCFDMVHNNDRSFISEGARFGRNPYSRPLSPAESFCPNITKSNWCPQSTNPQLRSSLKEKDTWFVKILQNKENIYVRVSGKMSIMGWSVLPHLLLCEKHRYWNYRRKFRKNTRFSQFCQLCNNLKADTKETAEVKQYVSNLGSGRCDTTKTHQTLNFKVKRKIDNRGRIWILKMCTPSRLEMEEKHEDMRDKFNEYWQYLKQVGVEMNHF